MDAHLCWAGTRNAAANGAAADLAGLQTSDEANRTALSRGGMAADGDLGAAGVRDGGERDAKIR